MDVLNVFLEGPLKRQLAEIALRAIPLRTALLTGSASHLAIGESRAGSLRTADLVQSLAVDRSPYVGGVCCFALWVFRASIWRLGTDKNERGLLVRVRRNLRGKASFRIALVIGKLPDDPLVNR
jgi:hypothetical protein